MGKQEATASVRRVSVWSSSLHWISIIATGLLVIAVFAVMFNFYLDESGPERAVSLADVTESQLTLFLKDETNLDIRDVAIDNKRHAITVTYLNDNASNENTILYNISKDGQSILPHLFQIADVERVKLIELGTFVDEAGNSDVEASASITITRKEADEIDWETINSPNAAGLLEHAAELHIHPAIREQLDDANLLNAIITQLSTN